MDLYFELAKDPEVGTFALDALPELVSELAKVVPKVSIERFQALAEWVQQGRAGLDVANVIGSLRHVRRLLSGGRDSRTSEGQEIEGLLASLSKIQSRLEDPVSADFGVRLKNWTGGWTSLQPEDIIENSDGRMPYDLAIETLTREAVNHPDLMTPETIEWLLQDKAEKSDLFFQHLGRADTNRTHLALIDKLSLRDEGAVAFASYLGGWAELNNDAAETHLDDLMKSRHLKGRAILLASGRLRPTHSAVSRVVHLINLQTIDRESAANVMMGWMGEIAAQDFQNLIRAIAGPDLASAQSAVRMFGRWIQLGREITDTLADFGWECLQGPPGSIQSQYHLDRLVGKLAERDPERGFELLRGYIEEELDESDLISRKWNPLAVHAQIPGLWKVLHAKDNHRLYQMLLDGARRREVAKFRLCWRLRELVDQEQDGQVLTALASGSAESASIIAQWLYADHDGFWPLVFELHNLFPDDEELHQNLAAAIERRESSFVDPKSDHNAALVRELEGKIKDSSTPPSARLWLREIVGRVSERPSKEIIWDYDLKVDDLGTFIKDKSSPQRLWAIGRILKFAKFEDIRRMLTMEDIEDSLPYVDLPEERRRILEQALPIWRHAS